MLEATELTCERASAPAGAQARWRATAFGLSLRGDFPALGFPSNEPVGIGYPRVRVTVVSEEQAAERWGIEDGRRLLDWRFEHGQQMMSINHHPERGYRLFAVRQGVHILSADGSRIWSAPGDAEPWIWQRYLVGQVLPLVALVNGYEVLHGSSLAIGGRAVAFLAGSGVGKSSIAANLMLRGARLLSDDVTVLSLRDGQPLVNPALGFLNLRLEEAQRLAAKRLALGQQVGADSDGGLRLSVPRATAPAPLAAVYLPERDFEGPRPRFEQLPAVDFALLVRNIFSQYLSTPQRWVRQLDIFSAIAERTSAFRLRIPKSMGAEELVAHIEAHVNDELA